MTERSNLGRYNMTLNGAASAQIERNAVIRREDQICIPKSPKQLHLNRTSGQFTVSLFLRSLVCPL